MRECRVSAGDTAHHISVMPTEVVDALNPTAGAVYVDGTFGAGGYSRLLLETAGCTVVALDRDPTVKTFADALSRQYPGRFQLIIACFSEMAERLKEAGYSMVDGVTLDIGVSSMQIDQGERGFSFQADGPLDMRMSGGGPTAADAVNRLDQDELAAVLFHYGEERRSRAIARKIVEKRAEAPIVRTGQLAQLVAQAVPGAPGKHPATRTFQALRIFVNDELRELFTALCAAEKLLRPSGRLAIVSFHSLEDRIVKEFFAIRSGATPGISRHLPPKTADGPAASFRQVWRGARKAGKAELAANPRARSARLRCAERTDAPAWPATAPMPEILAKAPASISKMIGAGG